MNLTDLYEKLRKVEALVAQGATEGERAAAANAEAALRARLETYARDPVAEWTFTIHDPWKRRLFFALCRRHGLEPYRYKRQKRQTVMLRASRRTVDLVLWPEFEKMADILYAYLDEVTTRVIEDVLGQADQDANVVSGELPR